MNNYNLLFTLSTNAQTKFLHKFSFHTKLHFTDKVVLSAPLHIYNNGSTQLARANLLFKEVFDKELNRNKAIIAFVVNCHYDNKVHMICGYVYPKFKSTAKGVRIEFYDPNSNNVMYNFHTDMYGHRLNNAVNKFYKATMNYFYTNYGWTNFSGYTGHNLQVTLCGRNRGICALWCVVHIVCTLWCLSKLTAYSHMNTNAAVATNIISIFRNLEKPNTIKTRHKSLKNAANSEKHQLQRVVDILTYGL